LSGDEELHTLRGLGSGKEERWKGDEAVIGEGTDCNENV